MRIRRTIPPTAAPINPIDLMHGFGGLFSNGQKCRETLEGEIREYFGVKLAVFVSSGKAALTLILLALKQLSKRKRVLIPAYTCYSVPSAILKAGLEVALCDIDPATFEFEPRSLETSIDEETLCVIPSHLFGIASNMDLIDRLCRERGVYIVEDAAQAMGSVYRDRKLGTIGDAGFFSLGRGKNITCGSGGIIVTNSPQIALAIERLCFQLEVPGFWETVNDYLQLLIMAIFVHPSVYWLPANLPFLKLGETRFYSDFPVKKISAMKVGCLRDWSRRLESANQARSGVSDYFRQQLPWDTSTVRSATSYLRFPLLMENRETRDQVYHRARNMGLGFSRMYPAPINEIDEIKTLFDGRKFPGAKRVADGILTIPTHYLMAERDKEAICTLLQSFDMQAAAINSFSENRQAVTGTTQN